MRSTAFLPVLCTAGVFLAGCTRSHAVLAVSNLGEGGVSAYSVAEIQAVKFTTGAGAGWTLDSVTANLERDAGSPDVVTGTLFVDNSGLPGSPSSGVLGTATGTGNYTFTSSSLITLAPNTSYWFAVSNGDPTPPNFTFWSYISSPNQSGLAGWDISYTRVQGLNGGADGCSLTPNSTPSAYQLAINVTPVPESSGDCWRSRVADRPPPPDAIESLQIRPQITISTP